MKEIFRRLKILVLLGVLVGMVWFGYQSATNVPTTFEEKVEQIHEKEAKMLKVETWVLDKTGIDLDLVDTEEERVQKAKKIINKSIATLHHEAVDIQMSEPIKIGERTFKFTYTLTESDGDKAFGWYSIDLFTGFTEGQSDYK